MKKNKNHLLNRVNKGVASRLLSFVATSALIFTLLTACQPQKNSGARITAEDPKPTPSAEADEKQKNEAAESPVDAFKKRLAADLESLKSGAVIEMEEAKSKGYFRKVFGGISSREVRQYLDDRVKIYLHEDELKDASLIPMEFRYTKWAEIPNLEKQMEDKGAEIVAFNLGGSLFRSGAIDGVVPVLSLPGHKPIRIDNPRVGVIVVGKGYTDVLEISPGKRVALPVGDRLNTLLHEARHSDCPGGSSSSDFVVGRTAENYLAFSAQFKKTQCGFPHSICPEKSSFAGLPACDSAPWGPYAIGAIYTTAIAAKEADLKIRRFYEALAADAISRISYSYEDLLNGKLGEPDMSSGAFKFEELSASP